MFTEHRSSIETLLHAAATGIDSELLLCTKQERDQSATKLLNSPWPFFRLRLRKILLHSHRLPAFTGRLLAMFINYACLCYGLTISRRAAG